MKKFVYCLPMVTCFVAVFAFVSSCSDAAKETNRTDAIASAEFSAIPTTGIIPLAVQFTDLSDTTSEETITAWTWDFDNDGIVDSTDQNPSYIYSSPGTYTAKLSVSGPGGSDDEIKTGYITVSSLIADFSADSTQGDAPLTLNFFDLSSSSNTIISWAWDFNNDGAVDSTEQNPGFTYNNEGRYTVALTVSDSNGSTTEVKDNYIYSKGYYGVKVIYSAKTNVETSAGKYSSIAVAPDNIDGDNVYISYYTIYDDVTGGDTFYDLRLSKSMNGGRTFNSKTAKYGSYYGQSSETVSTYGRFGYYTSIVAVKGVSEDSIYISHDSDNFGSGNPLTQYIRFEKSTDSGISWNDSTIITSTFDGKKSIRSNIAIAGSDVYISYYNFDSAPAIWIGLSKSTDSGTSWLPGNRQLNIRETTEEFTHAPLSVVDDASDRIYTSYIKEDAPQVFQLYLAFSTDAGTSWNDRLLDTVVAADLSYPSVKAVADLENGTDGNTNDNVYVVYYEDTTLKIARSFMISTGFTQEDILTGTAGVECPSIEVISDNNDGDDIYISFIHNNQIMFARSLNGGDTWITRDVDLNGGEYTSIAVNDDNVYISYYQNNSLRFAKSIDNGNSWN